MECKYTLATWHKHWAQRMHVVCVCALSQQCVFLRIQNKSLHKFYVLFFHQFYFIFGYNRVVRRFLYVSRDSLFVAIWFFSFTSFDCAQFLSLKWLNNAFCGSQEHKCMQQSEKRARETKRIAIKSIVVCVFAELLSTMLRSMLPEKLEHHERIHMLRAQKHTAKC